MKINSFRGDLTDKSAKKEPLSTSKNAMMVSCTSSLKDVADAFVMCFAFVVDTAAAGAPNLPVVRGRVF